MIKTDILGLAETPSRADIHQIQTLEILIILATETLAFSTHIAAIIRL
jgi:hypothetical protein